MQGEFPDDVSEAAVGPIFTGHESERKEDSLNQNGHCCALQTQPTPTPPLYKAAPHSVTHEPLSSATRQISDRGLAQVTRGASQRW